MTDFDPLGVLDANVDAVTARLADFDAVQLQALHDAEGKRDGGGRTTLLTGIHTAMAALADAAATKNPAVLPTIAELEEAKAEKAKADVGNLSPAAAAVEKAKVEEAARIAATQKARSARPPRAGKPTAKAAKASGDALTIDRDAGDLIPLLAHAGEGEVVFAGEDDERVEWPPLTFPADKFRAARAGAVLEASIDLHEGLPAALLHSAWLVVGGKAVAVARLAAPLLAGGGRKAELPRGTTLFRNDG